MDYIIPKELSSYFEKSDYKKEEVFYCKIEAIFRNTESSNYKNNLPIRFARHIYLFNAYFTEKNIKNFIDSFVDKNYESEEYFFLKEFKKFLKEFKQLKKFSWYNEFRDILNKIKFRKRKGTFSTITQPDLIDRYKVISDDIFYDLNILYTAIVNSSNKIHKKNKKLNTEIPNGSYESYTNGYTSSRYKDISDMLKFEKNKYKLYSNGISSLTISDLINL
jgi:hypothetical protein